MERKIGWSRMYGNGMKSGTMHATILMAGLLLAGLSGCAGSPDPAQTAAALPPPPPTPPPALYGGALAVNGSTLGDGSMLGAGLPGHFQETVREKYSGEAVGSIKLVADQPISTFSVDVDTGAYANMRRFLSQGLTPPAAAVRTEELINYFRYDYPKTADRTVPFTITTDIATTPWTSKSRLLRIGLRGYDLPYAERPSANLVFLVDVSGSMNAPNKLPLVKAALAMVADNMRPQDKVAIVVYAGAAGVVLEPTNDAAEVKAALSRLSAGGSTAGGAGLALAYDIARKHFRKDGINRILVATDGDFNVGQTDQTVLEQMIGQNRDSGITLTTLGFGQGNYNEALMESLADLGNGSYAYIDSANEARKVLDEQLSSTLFTIAKDVKIQIEFNPAHVREYRLIGYENRLLAEEDFVNDKADAGDVGAGHQVTAIYEIIPAGSTGWLPERRYEGNRRAIAAYEGKENELGFLRLRYKLPDGKESRLIERSIAASSLSTARPPRGDFAFAVAVAAFGQRLRGDKYLGDYSFTDIEALGGAPSDFARQEFINLLKLARTLNKPVPGTAQ